MIPWLSRQPVFPPVDSALREPEGPNGLLAAGGDLTPARLLAAYRLGIFPWYSAGEPILWWSPDPRMVLMPGALKISRSLGKTLRHKPYDVRLDSCFSRVMAECAEPRRPGHQAGTWISPEMQAAYTRLHQLGHAHSVETWVDDELVGGLYGIALGRVFYGESMFSRQPDASKIALAHLCHHLKHQNYVVIDCQMETAHLASLGARPIPRQTFVEGLTHWTQENFCPGAWDTHAVQDVFKTPQP